MTSLRVTFANNVKAIRQDKNLSQEGLAFACNLHRTYISDIERGKRNVSIDNIEKIALALEVNPYELLIKNKMKLK
ncbi:helix-turn-helix domain-containing protein [Enterococcus quebecensis]|uniref:Transcriptional regulator n=1 Tax=Enterococcus quebecensis TaxID=903983 RepID=A0A1E5GUL6_9ENTE|nr:helix-turn-helix transcriptional regulator [Enterococcus quebecensis]OEG16365.1 transcriptional regulator [Enterococcus quebecensis]OJG72765.1 transcriptional regulator [Enterococcus quebecensis]